MSLQFSTTLRNAILDVIESHIGVSAVIKIFDGVKPASISDADAGTVLSTTTVPADWMAAAASGSKVKQGTWEDPSADATGTATYFRVYASNGTTCHMQGDCTNMAGAGPMKISSLSIVETQPVVFTLFTLHAGNE